MTTWLPSASRPFVLMIGGKSGVRVVKVEVMPKEERAEVGLNIELKSDLTENCHIFLRDPKSYFFATEIASIVLFILKPCKYPL
jgi:hypothetical protein